MEISPGLLGSETGDPVASCREHFWPDTVTVKVAIADTPLNSAT